MNLLTSQATLGIITASKGKTQKTILFKDGKAVKDGKASLGITRGTAHNIAVDGLAGLKLAIETIKPNQALTLGTIESVAPMQLLTAARFEQAGEPSGTVTRTKKHFSWPADNHFILLDHDPEPGQPDLTAEQFWQKLTSLIPELAGIGRVVTTSSSSGIYNKLTGECLKPESGHHTFLQVRGEVTKLVELVKVRGWAQGASFLKLASENSATGVSAILERHLLDTAVFSPERLVYEAGARFEWNSPLEQRRTPPRLYSGEVLDCGCLPSPTEAEWAAAKAAKAAAYTAIGGTQVESATKAIAKTGHKAPKSEAQRRIHLVRQGKLEPDHVLEIVGGGTLLAGDIAAHHDGMIFADPQEPTYRGGAAVARLYWNDGKGWVIHSQAHGGCDYTAAAPHAGSPAVSIADWKAQKRYERDQQAYKDICKMLGLPDSTVEGLNKDQARAALYQPLAKYLGSELTGDRTKGFTKPMPKPSGERSLSAADADKGTSKTNGVLMHDIRAAVAGGKKALTIVPTRGLASDLATRINTAIAPGTATTHEDPNWRSFPVVVSCPESAYKFKGENFHTVLFDEVNEDIERIQGGYLGNAGQESAEAITWLLENCTHCTIATADMWQKSLDAIQRIGRFTDEQTTIQRVSRPDTPMEIVKHGDFCQWLNRIVRDIRAGKRPYITCGSQAKARLLDRILRAIFPDGQGYCIDGKQTLQHIRTAFLSSADEFVAERKPSWLIQTPVANSGISYEGGWFDVQYEYISPGEGAQSASQRGERNRSAIGRDGRIAARHVYFAKTGEATIENYPEALDPAYWLKTLASDNDVLIGAAAPMAKALGVTDALDKLRDEQKVRAEQRPELPYFWAIKALDIFYKRDRLEAEWLSYGWKITEAAPPSDLAEANEIVWIKGLIENIAVGLMRQDGRTLRKARSRTADLELSEATNPFQRQRLRKAHAESVVGAEFLSRQDDDFFTAWLSDNHQSNPGIATVVRSRLMDAALNRPDEFAAIVEAMAIRTLSGKPNPKNGEFWELPALPAPPREIELANLLSQCPGIREILSGTLTEWSNYTEVIEQAASYLSENADRIAALTRRAGLERGYKFSPAMKAAGQVQKVLKLLGHSTIKRRAGEGQRWNIHRLSTANDTQIELEKLKQKWELTQPGPLEQFRAEMKAVRAQTRQALDAAIDAQLVCKMAAWTNGNPDVQSALQAIKSRHTLLMVNTSSEVCDAILKPPETPPPLTAREQFEQALRSAQTFAELQQAKNAASESLRREVMAEWLTDGRYEWLMSRAAELKAAA